MEKLKLFLDYMHTTLTEQLWYNVNLFNQYSNGAIVLSSERAPIMQGGISQQSYFQLPDNMIQRRNPVGKEPLELINLANKMQNTIRIAWTTKMVNLSRNVWDWIGRDSSIAGVIFGRALAQQMITNYLLRAFSILKATVGANDSTVIDVSGEKDAKINGISYQNLLYTADAFGDSQSAIRAWIMPTMARTDLLASNMDNPTQLFKIDSVTIATDVEGRTIITSDDPNLREFDDAGNIKYWVFGLAQSAITITDLDDWDEAYNSGTTGFENILRTYQSNWSSKINVKGYKYDANQLDDSDDDKGKFASASDAALYTPENWEQVPLSHKETAGVALICKSNRPSYARARMYNHK